MTFLISSATLSKYGIGDPVSVRIDTHRTKVNIFIGSTTIGGGSLVINIGN